MRTNDRFFVNETKHPKWFFNDVISSIQMKVVHLANMLKSRVTDNIRISAINLITVFVH